MPFVAAAVWTRHADAIKAASPVTEWLTSSSLRRWNFGWPAQRLDPSAWHSILQHTVPSLLSLYAVLLVPAAIAAWRSTQRLFWLAVASAVVLPPLVFMNLYVNHDYYPAAISPAIAALLGLGCGWVWAVVRPRWLVAALPCAALLLAWGTLELGRGYWLRIHGGYDDLQAMPLASEIAAHTRSDDLVGTVGLDWSPAVLYYAHRRGNMVTAHARDAGLDAIHDDGYRYLLVAEPLARGPGVHGRGGGGSARSAPHLYGLADSASHLPPADLLATDPGRSLAGRLDQRGARRRCPGRAEVRGRDTHSRGTGGDVAALRRGCPRGSGVGRRPRARTREARRLRLARTRPERHARRLVRGARGAQPGRRAGRSCASLSVPTYPGEP